MTEVLMISKPIVPPWDDSAKNIVRSQILHSHGFTYRILGTRETASPAPHITVDPIYDGAGAYSPGLRQNLKVMRHGLWPRGAAIYHYFFAPNRVTSTAGRLQCRLARVRSVQTVCSQPLSFNGIDRLLFCDKVAVLSSDTMHRMVQAGVDPARLVHVRPGIDPIDPPSPEQKRAIRALNGIPLEGPLMVFPGDYEFSSAARTVGEAAPMLAEAHPDLTIVFACRIKRAPSRLARDEIKRQVERAGLGKRVLFLSRVSDMPAFMGTAHIVVMPAESLYAKMDVPLVLLEAMSQGVPLVLANVPPLNELLACDCGLSVSPGDAAALAEAVGRLINDRALASGLGANGAKAVRETYSSAAMASSMERIYNEVLKK